jgi:hypothetical protein
MQRLLYMIKVQQWSIRTNPTANDLAIKQYLLSIMYSYSIYLIMIECFLSIYTRILLDSIIYHNSVLLLITMLYFINVKCSGLVIRFMRSDNQMDDISVAHFALNMRYLVLVLLIVFVIGSLLFFIHFIFYKILNM